MPVASRAMTETSTSDAAALDGRRVLVTGASSGIGEAIARGAADAGARVAVLARRADRLATLSREISGVAVPADVTDHDATAAAVHSAATGLGGLDAVVNAAGVMAVGSPATTEPAEWRAMFEVNVLGLLAVTAAAVPHLRRSTCGSIVNIGSMSGRRVPRSGSGIYAASKFAVHAATEALRMELAHDGIRVTTLAPGFVHSELADGWEDREAAGRWKAGARQGLDPDRVGDAVVHLLALPPEVTVLEYAVQATNQAGGPTR